MVDAVSARLLSISRVEPGDMLVYEDVTGAFAARAKAVLQHRTVVAVRSQPGSRNVLSNPTRSVQYLGRDHPALIIPTMKRGGALGFLRIVCLGRPDLSARVHLADSLKEWKTYLAPGGKVVVEMHRNPSSPAEHWKVTEAAYRESIKSTGFELEQINGIERDEIFSTGAVEIYTYALSLKQTAQLIRPQDERRAQQLIMRSRILFARLKTAKRTHRVEEMLEELVEANLGHRLFATLRLG
jgi:hypothetical protein